MADNAIEHCDDIPNFRSVQEAQAWSEAHWARIRERRRRKERREDLFFNIGIAGLLGSMSLDLIIVAVRIANGQ